MGVEVVFSTGASVSTTREAMILADGRGWIFHYPYYFSFLIFFFFQLEIPVVRFDDTTSSYSRIEDEGEVIYHSHLSTLFFFFFFILILFLSKIYLELEPIEGLREGDEVLDYIWEQVRGPQVTCIDRFFLSFFEFLI